MSDDVQIESSPLDDLNENRLAFVSYVLAGKSYTKSYELAFPGTTRNTARVNGSRLANDVLVRRAIEYMYRLSRGSVEQRLLATREEVLHFLTRAIRVPISEVDEDDPLATKMIVRVDKKGTRTTTIEKVDPIAAAREVAKMEGWYDNTEKVAGLPINRLLAMIRPIGMPGDTVIDAEAILLDVHEDEEEELLDDGDK